MLNFSIASSMGGSVDFMEIKNLNDLAFEHSRQRQMGQMSSMTSSRDL
jgi:hypothetical protein